MAETDSVPQVQMSRNGKSVAVSMSVVGVLTVALSLGFWLRDGALSRIAAAEASVAQVAKAQQEDHDRIIRMEANAANTDRSLDEIKRGIESMNVKLDDIGRRTPR